MAYVITPSCTKDELCVEACPVDCIHPKKDEEGFGGLLSFSSIRSNASTAAPAFRFARYRRFSRWTIFRRDMAVSAGANASHFGR